MMHLRLIKPEDNIALAKIIRATLTEFGANHPGTVFYDDSTDALYELFQTPRSCYFVLLIENKIVGGAGIFPTPGLPDDTCELVKMYVLPEARGKGYGSLLISNCEAFALETGFKKIYLETLPELTLALKVYEKSGYTYLKKALGNSGHFGCNLWMIKKIQS